MLSAILSVPLSESISNYSQFRFDKSLTLLNYIETLVVFLLLSNYLIIASARAAFPYSGATMGLTVTNFGVPSPYLY